MHSTAYRVEINSVKRRCVMLYSWVSLICFTNSSILIYVIHALVNCINLTATTAVYFFFVFLVIKKFIYVDFNYVKHLSPSHCECWICIYMQFGILFKILASIWYAMWLRITASCLFTKLSSLISYRRMKEKECQLRAAQFYFWKK